MLVRAGHAIALAARSLGDVLNAFRHARQQERWMLALLVLRMRAKQFLLRVPFPWRFHEEMVFGRRVECFDYPTLVCLVEEIFLRRDYQFSSGKERPLIIDCGSNIGLSLLYFKREFPHCQIQAFEPDPETFSLLRRNVEQNELHDVQLHCLALGAAPGARQLFCDPVRPGSTSMSLRAESGLDERRTVPCGQLSDYIHADIDFLKLDVEGAELEVIEDLVRTGKIKRVMQMVIEYHPLLFPGRDGCAWLTETLKKCGFVCETRGVVPTENDCLTARLILLFASRGLPEKK